MPPCLSTVEVLADPLRQKFIEILKSHGIYHDVDKITMVEPPELKGEHMATSTVYVKVDFKDTSIPAKNLFVKKSLNNALSAQWTKDMRIMEKEALFYNKVLPEARQFSGKYIGCERILDFFPKCLYGGDDMIVLENLVLDQGYIMLSKEEQQDLYTAKYVLGNLAKFHASMYSWIEKKCGGCLKFQKDWEAACFEAFVQEKNPMMEPMFDNGLGTCINILKKYPVEKGAETIKILEGYMGKTYPLVGSLMRNTANSTKMQTLLHGDCWNNNMLFKKDPATGKVNDHLFVDLQITRLGSPNLDIGYFLFTSVQPEVRRSHLVELLRHYYDSFVETVSRYNVKCPLSFDEFYDDYREKSQAGYIFGLTIITMLGAMKEIDLESMSENMEEMIAQFDLAIDNWVKANPSKAEKIATEVVAMVEESGKLLEGAKFANILTISLTSKEWDEKFKEILKSNGISQEVAKITMYEPSHLVGEHMATSTVYVEVDFRDAVTPRKNLFVKKFTSNPVMTEWCKEMKLMQKESMFFNKYLPTVREFCGKYKGGENLMSMFPPVLYGDDDMIVLENVVLNDGFTMLDKADKQDLHTAKLTLSNLAKLHAVSHAFVQIEAGGNSNFRDKWEVVCFEAFLAEKCTMITEMFDTGMKTCTTILKGCPVNGGDEVIEILTNLKGETYPIVSKMLRNSVNDKFQVVNHGDAWNNNMLFKKDPITGVVNDHIFVDLQVTRFGSPSFDLGYFLYTSVKPDTRRQYFRELLLHYFHTVEKTLAIFGLKCPVTFEEFVDDYREKSHLGYFLSFMSMSGFEAMKEIDTAKLQDNPDNFDQIFTTLMTEWAANNPSKAGKIGNEIVATVQEHNRLVGKN